LFKIESPMFRRAGSCPAAQTRYKSQKQPSEFISHSHQHHRAEPSQSTVVLSPENEAALAHPRVRVVEKQKKTGGVFRQGGGGVVRREEGGKRMGYKVSHRMSLTACLQRLQKQSTAKCYGCINCIIIVVVAATQIAAVARLLKRQQSTTAHRRCKDVYCCCQHYCC
jgi:hypothetical protein